MSICVYKAGFFRHPTLKSLVAMPRLTFLFVGEEYATEYDPVEVCANLKCAKLQPPDTDADASALASTLMQTLWSDETEMVQLEDDAEAMVLAVLLQDGFLTDPELSEGRQPDREGGATLAIKSYLKRRQQKGALHSLIAVALDTNRESLAHHSTRVLQRVEALTELYEAHPALYERHLAELVHCDTFVGLLTRPGLDMYRKEKLVKRLLKMAHGAAVAKSSENAPSPTAE